MFLLLLFLLPISTLAISKDYNDVLDEYLNISTSEDKINIYFFYGDGCPHCAKEELFLDDLQNKYKDKVNIYRFETWNNENNRKYMLTAKERLGQTVNQSVPFTVIGEKYYSGYANSIGEKIEKDLLYYLEEDGETIEEMNSETIPFIGRVNVKETSILLLAVILGFVDGFNPCATWVLLFLINMLFDMKDKKRMMLLGITFLFVSGFVYFLSMLGITTILSIISVSLIRTLIGIFGFALGVLNIRKFIKNRNKDDGCTVVDAKKRKKMLTRIKKFTTEKNILLALLGVIILAVSVNLVELACSSVFPAIFSEILAINTITGIPRILYLIVYIIFYMIDDMFIFIVSVSTLELTVNSNIKYAKYSSLISGIIMIIIGLLLIFEPGIIMFNF
jgi:thiol-disulfide isomerase/thioredoxin